MQDQFATELGVARAARDHGKLQALCVLLSLGLAQASGAVNVAPAVSLTAPTEGATYSAPASVTLTASASDSDGSIASVKFYSGLALLYTDTSAPYTMTYPSAPAGTYKLKAVATDNLGATTTSSTVNISVTTGNAAPTVSLTSPSSGASATAPASFSLAANAADSDGSIASVAFYSGSTLLGSDSASPYTWEYSSVPAGSYALTAKATDNAGAVTTSGTVNVSVTATGNAAPTVSLTSPSGGDSAVAPASFSLSANAADSDGTVSKVEFHSNGALINTDTSAPFAYSYENLAAGSYALTAIATDDGGATTTSATVTVTATTDPTNAAPTVSLTSPTDGGSSAAPADVLLKAIASDSDGTVAAVQFWSNGVLVWTDTVADPYRRQLTELPAGIYEFKAVAIDNDGASTSSGPVMYTVTGLTEPPPPPPPAGTVSATRTFVYDANGRLCKTINPESGSTVIEYDAAGNITWTAEGLALPLSTACNRESVTAGQKTVRTYDAMNRVIAVSTPGGTADLITTYEPDGLVSSLTAANPGGIIVTTTYSYNNRRLLTAETSNNNGEVLYGLGYGYNANGHLSELTYPDGQTVGYLPDALGRATKVGVTGGHTYASNISYFPNGAIRTFTYGNGIVHTMDHAINPTTQMSRQLPGRSRDLKGTSIILDDTYEFDKNGNVEHITDATPAGLDNRSRDLGYDGLDRLIVADSLYQWGPATYAYDALDNLRLADYGSRKYRYTYDPTSNRLTAINDPAGVRQFALGYDARGNTILKDGASSQAFVFDASNRLNEVTGQQVYRYDGQGRRVQTTDVGSSSADDMYWIYSQSGQVLYTHESRRSRNLSYIYLGNTQVATRAIALPGGAETISYQHTDSLGSIVAETNASGVVTKRNSYAPYGEALAWTVVDGTGYTGHVMDQATGLTYMQQRYSDPQIGRFLSVDPVPASTGVGFNRYSYANNNPYRFTDPDGRWAEDLILGVPSIILGGKSLYENVSAGNYGSAVVDGLGILADGVAIATPGVPGGAGMAIGAARLADKAADAGRAAARVGDDALVVRGGSAAGANSAEGIAKGTGTHPEGVTGFSAESANGASLCDLCQNIGHNQVGVTTAGQVRAAGGDVVSTGGRSPNHATVTGLSPEKAAAILKVQDNPIPKAERNF
ncbi:MAG: Ig-like domain-containing protein [Arenimonas sp.]